MDAEQEEAASPTSWLWQEIARRFGHEAAEELHEAYMVQMRQYNQKLALKTYRKQLFGIEAEIARRKAQGLSTVAAEKRLALRMERLKAAREEGVHGGE